MRVRVRVQARMQCGKVVCVCVWVEGRNLVKPGLHYLVSRKSKGTDNHNVKSTDGIRGFPLKA